MFDEFLVGDELGRVLQIAHFTKTVEPSREETSDVEDSESENESEGGGSSNAGDEPPAVASKEVLEVVGSRVPNGEKRKAGVTAITTLHLGHGDSGDFVAVGKADGTLVIYRNPASEGGAGVDSQEDIRDETPIVCLHFKSRIVFIGVTEGEAHPFRKKELICLSEDGRSGVLDLCPCVLGLHFEEKGKSRNHRKRRKEGAPDPSAPVDLSDAYFPLIDDKVKSLGHREKSRGLTRDADSVDHDEVNFDQTEPQLPHCCSLEGSSLRLFRVSGGVRCAALDSEGRYLAIGGAGVASRIVDLMTLTVVFSAKNRPPDRLRLYDAAHTTSMAFLPQKTSTRILITGTESGKAAIYPFTPDPPKVDAVGDKGGVQCQCEGPVSEVALCEAGRPVLAIAISPKDGEDGEFKIAVADNRGNIHLYAMSIDTASGRGGASGVEIDGGDVSTDDTTSADDQLTFSSLPKRLRRESVKMHEYGKHRRGDVTYKREKEGQRVQLSCMQTLNAVNGAVADLVWKAGGLFSVSTQRYACLWKCNGRSCPGKGPPLKVYLKSCPTKCCAV